MAPTQWLSQARACAQAGFAFFDWLSAVDHTGARGDGTTADVEDGDEEGREPGFLLVAHLMAVGPQAPRPLARVLLRTLVPDGTAVDSLTPVFAGAAWHERETHEMFAVPFTGFDDGTGAGLRPLLLPPGFEGAPLRKSFVLAARASKAWPGAKEPGESSEGGPAPARRGGRRRRLLPPGVPDPSWGPRPATEGP
ncbi:MAG TPA: NADH-quinone oxidoreductase subunit C [Ornithinimicrobium sp.]|uniref:NADH-quinone oxidoreductase subunit C n=1 Tax=Ornithinimicrobium sp. TaxID=1977084 RepID=UPI002B4A302C|nr:NADH-quinone oxidoreductase subunit C [Ornithinimicrobium sp.]HKJ11644.1 NADH-quinone oxidoreductase subunit C [Ornithinimicrobium sp.]